MANARQHDRRSSSTNLILKEGFLFKKGGLIKSWSRRYFILNRESLCYFKHELQAQQREDGGQLEPLGRVFLTDIVSIGTEGVEKKKAFVFALRTPKRAVLLQAANTEDKESWAEAIKRAKDADKEAEKKDPFRRTLRRLAPGLKRVTLVKDPEKGIGCTIKNAAGHILVNRIIEEGPIAHTGVLRPGDEFLDIHGTTVTGLQVAEVVAVIRASPDEFLATVRPITALKKGQKQDVGTIIYSDILPQSQEATPTSALEEQRSVHLLSNEASLVPKSGAGKSAVSSHTPSLDDLSPNAFEDLGNYDDEEEGDTPPPLPPRTEDALILVDPPPLPSSDAKRPPPLPPKPQGDEVLAELVQKHDHDTRRAVMAKMQRKSRSCEDAEDEVQVPRGKGSGAPHRSPQRHHHLYEEIKPALHYIDIAALRHKS